jgi:hypothetical protein
MLFCPLLRKKQRVNSLSISVKRGQTPFSPPGGSGSAILQSAVLQPATLRRFLQTDPIGSKIRSGPYTYDDPSNATLPDDGLLEANLGTSLLRVQWRSRLS